MPIYTHLLQKSLRRTSIHFPQHISNISLRAQAIPSPRPVVVARAPWQPDLPLLDRILLLGFPIIPHNAEGEVGDQAGGEVDDQAGVEVDDQAMFRDPDHIVQGRIINNRSGSVACAHILVLALSLLTTFSVDDVTCFLTPRFIAFSRDVAWFMWDRACLLLKQRGPSLAVMIANSYHPEFCSTVSNSMCRLPPDKIARFPRVMIALLPPSTIETLPRSCIETLPPSCIETLSPSCIETLSPSCIETLSPSSIARLPRSCINSLTLHPVTQIQVQLIILQRIVDAFSLGVADLVPSVPVPFVIFAMRFGISLGFWSLSLALWRLLGSL